MDIEKYITSGILELYVAGTLSEQENLEVVALAAEHPEIKKEIEEIEASILALSKVASPKRSSVKGFNDVLNRIQDNTKVIPLNEKKSNWSSYLGWAAAIVLAVGFAWMYNQNTTLQSEINVASQNNELLEKQIEDAKTSLDKSQELLTTIRDKDIQVVALGGQAVSPTSYAKAYWNKREQKVFIDAQGLPEPPDGMVYQVWSLKLDPLTPTSMGLLEDFITDDNKVFALANPNASEAFGITLEPAGGSESPNLEQLYTLGAVSS
ncbi:anti-sigma factor [Cellulophaga baltica]|uniref:anti-sigma factor n=1 Tax=Cellulophaga TaxID=104264 RepID=UPI001C06FA72|nr:MULTISPECIES: anti-sigma factor [Cellulophaga]MBU2997359.1 anti-sigma factor [Cellulophaga baltica]MDO6768756.1 anti-sigma factor [Cellulophaga sp. 1_MG-2023]